MTVDWQDLARQLTARMERIERALGIQAQPVEPGMRVTEHQLAVLRAMPYVGECDACWVSIEGPVDKKQAADALRKLHSMGMVNRVCRGIYELTERGRGVRNGR